MDQVLSVEKPGIYKNVHEAIYHGDPCPTPSLSSGLAKTLINLSPAHAWISHPRLNPAYRNDHSKKMDFGAAAHSLMLNRGAEIALLSFDDFKKKAAREARDRAIGEGKTPILMKDWPRLEAMVKAGRAQIDNHPFHKNALHPDYGDSEVSCFWKDGPQHDPESIWCRMRVDWVPHGNGNCFYDYKTIDGHVNTWSENLARVGGEFQNGLYRRGLKKIHALNDAEEKEFHMFYVVQEVNPPFALQIIEFDPEHAMHADSKADAAIHWWAACMKSGRFPGYSTATAYCYARPWVLTQWENRTIGYTEQELFEQALDLDTPDVDAIMASQTDEEEAE